MRTDRPHTSLQPATADEPRTPDAGILAEITAGLARGSDLGGLLQRFLEPIMHLAGAQAGAVRALSDDGEQLQLVSDLGLPAGVHGSEREVDRHCGHCGAAADGQQLVWASDLSVCSQREHGDFFGHGCQRLLAVPLQHRGRILGVYNLFFAGKQEPAPEILAILKSIGELLGLALNNARLEREHLRVTVMNERQMMAAEVHDSLAQSLAFVKMRMPLLHDAMLAHDDARALRYYDDVRGAVSQVHSSLRGILTHLRVPMDPQGLVHALEASAQTFRRTSATELEYVNAVPNLMLAPDKEAQVFHIVQEALANVARHAGAPHAWLSVAPASPGEVEIVIEDDGAGLQPAVSGGAHYGLEIMRERASRLGGSLELGARDGGGTRVRLTFAVPTAQPAAAAEVP